MENEEMIMGEEWIEWDSATNLVQDHPMQWDQVIAVDDASRAEKFDFSQNDARVNGF